MGLSRFIGKQMNFRNAQHKLDEQKGASLAMALFLLIVVITVSLLILNSALSNIGRTKRNIKLEQDYLTESSAVGMVKTWLSGIEMSYEKEENQTTGQVSYSSEVSYKDGLDGMTISGDNLFKEQLCSWFEASVKGTGTSADPTVYTITADNMDDVEMKLKLDTPHFDDGGSGGTASSEQQTTYITIDFSLKKADAADSDNYVINMKIPCLCTSESDSYDITVGTGTSAETQTVDTTTYKITTPSGTSDDNRIEIQKGSAIK